MNTEDLLTPTDTAVESGDEGDDTPTTGGQVIHIAQLHSR